MTKGNENYFELAGVRVTGVNCRVCEVLRKTVDGLGNLCGRHCQVGQTVRIKSTGAARANILV